MTKEMQKKYFTELQAKKAEIDGKTAPLAQKREALWKKIHPLKAEIDELAAKEKAIRGDDYHELCWEIGRVAKALGGKSLTDGS